MLRFETKTTSVEIGAGFFIVVTFMLLICDNKTVIISLISSLLHESGHLTAMLLSGEKPDKLVFSASGLRIDRKKVSSLNFSQEIIVALAGVSVNLFIALITFILYRFCGMQSANLIFSVNLVIAVFNLLPLESLDGARGLRFILCRRIPEERTDEIILNISVVTALFLVFFLILTIIMGFINPSLIVVIIYLVILLINRILQLKKSAI